jgi:hypothetical protein
MAKISRLFLATAASTDVIPLIFHRLLALSIPTRINASEQRLRFNLNTIHTYSHTTSKSETF